jgi:hypothetical protein
MEGQLKEVEEKERVYRHGSNHICSKQCIDSMQMDNSMSSKDAEHPNHGWFPMNKSIAYNAELMPT